jgi:chromosomal replication initiation ATPase DnaA
MQMPAHLEAMIGKRFKQDNSFSEAVIAEREAKRREKLERIEQDRQAAREAADRRERRRQQIDKILEAVNRQKREEAEAKAIPEYLLHIDRPMRLMKLFSQASGYTVSELQSPRRHKGLTQARQCLVWLMKQQTNFSYPRIGRKLGGRDHSTMLHAIKMVETKPKMFELANTLMAHVLEMEAEIYGA